MKLFSLVQSAGGARLQAKARHNLRRGSDGQKVARRKRLDQMMGLFVRRTRAKIFSARLQHALW